MKTTNKIQKTTLTASAAIALVIFSFAVNAQFAMKSFFHENETDHMAMAMGKTNNNFLATTAYSINLTSANTYATYLATETEEPMELEDWMVSESNFSTMSFIEAEIESPLEIEDWMTNESNFDVNSFSFETETENEMILEDWMTNEDIFTAKQGQSQANKENVNNKIISTGRFVFSEVNDESKLKIEDWMINPKVWK